MRASNSPRILPVDITSRQNLAFTNAPFVFTIPENIASGTPIGNFMVSGRVTDKDEALDGIITGDEASPFTVNDANMDHREEKWRRP